MEKKQILILGVNIFAINRGGGAMTMGIIRIMKEKLPTCHFTIFDGGGPILNYLTTFYNLKYKNDMFIDGNRKHISKIKRYLNIFFFLFLATGYNLSKKFNPIFFLKIFCLHPTMRLFLQSDYIINLNGGDCFTDRYKINLTFGTFYYPIICFLLHKPLIFLPQTIGPFTNPITKFIAKFILERIQIIMVREKNSALYIQNMGIKNKNIFLVPDAAFYLEPCSSNTAEKILENEGVSSSSKFLIGLSLRNLVIDGNVPLPIYQNYTNIMAKTIDYLCNEFDVCILTIPHSGLEYNKSLKKDIIDKVSNKNKIHRIEKREYTSEELKGVIGKCDMFIGTYMHANIAALSMCVPTIGLSYSYKFQGIFEMVGQEEYVCDLKNLSYENIISKVNDVWSKKEKIRTELETRRIVIQKQVLFTGELIKKFLDEGKSK
ncbi:MAG: hypothetical protein BWK75_00930 [Candidatus Altiarchaeales archaeon A3]|nr:MAG: hypothetical protein BWK75_00930 [Candidatus Altiarchaeales archaeon A3]